MNSTSETKRRLEKPPFARVAARAARAAVCALTLAGVSLACGESVPEPDEKSLRASFIAQIESIDLVKDLEVYGSEIHFARPDGSGADVDWRVRIDSLEVGPWAGPEAELAGHVVSRWSVAGRPVSVEIGPEGLVTDMPFFVLDAGLAPECWAFWDEEAKAWGW